ncbi:MAG: hypothetical protein ACR2GS_11665, partial [Thermomicrobiales bacterium]
MTERIGVFSEHGPSGFRLSGAHTCPYVVQLAAQFVDVGISGFQFIHSRVPGHVLIELFEQDLGMRGDRHHLPPHPRIQRIGVNGHRPTSTPVGALLVRLVSGAPAISAPLHPVPAARAGTPDKAIAEQTVVGPVL